MEVPRTEIIITDGGVEIARKIVAPGEYVIGRDLACDVQVTVGLVSRRHAKVIVNYNEWLVEDLGSANGTLVNGKRVAECTRLWPNQKIQIGSAMIELRRLRGGSTTGESIAPQTAAVRAVLPEAFLREKKYDIGGVVAQGGMGAILDAREATIERTVAMKVMLNSSTPESLQRFIAEAKITGQLEHPNIVPVHELSVDEQEQVFYTMKFVRGITLRKVLELIRDGATATAKKYTLTNLLTVFQKVCDAIAFAHSKRVIHRDLKPENIMIGDFGEVMVMDWGLAKVLDSGRNIGSEKLPARSVIRAASPHLGAGATMSGAIMGTPEFMAPEQATGAIETLDARTDIYQLGAILYQILTLRPPVQATTIEEALDQVRAGAFPPPRSFTKGKKRLPHLPGGRVPDSLSAVTMKALALDQAARYQAVPDLQAEIEAFQHGFATSAEKAGLAKQITLLIKRHKALAVAAAVVFVLVNAFMARVFVSERESKRLVARLQSTAPTFESNARALIEKSATEPAALERALESVNFAIDLAPQHTDYRLLKAGVLQTLQRPAEARAIYMTVLAREPANAVARENLALCEVMLREQKSGGSVSPATLGKLASSLRIQGRNAEALFVSRTFDKSGSEQLATWKAMLKKAGIVREPRLDAAGGLGVDLATTNLDNVGSLRGLPLNWLLINGNPVSDLSPLAGMPLRTLDLRGTRVTDLSPLRGAPLHSLVVPGGITDLSPLRGMPMEKLVFDRSPPATVSDFSVLRDMPLADLDLGYTRFADARLLAGKPLTRLVLDATQVSDLAPLRDLPIEALSLRALPKASLRDLSFIPVKTLKSVDLGGNKTLGDLSALHGSILEDLRLEDTAVLDLRPLAGSPLRVLWLMNAPVRDLAPLKELKRLEVARLENTAITDLTPLTGSGIEALRLAGCDSLRSAAPLATMPALKVVSLPVQVRDVDALRDSRSLIWIGYRLPPELAVAASRAAEGREFWKMHDLETALLAADGKLRPSKFSYMAQRFPGAQQIGASWYYYFRYRLGWAEAKKLAESMGGHLATLTTAEEDAAVRKLAVLAANTSVWLGGSTDKPGGEWKWVTGEPWSYTKWAKRTDGKNEPNGTPAKIENALALAAYPGFSPTPDWADAAEDSDKTAGFLIEWDE